MGGRSRLRLTAYFILAEITSQHPRVCQILCNERETERVMVASKSCIANDGTAAVIARANGILEDGTHVEFIAWVTASV